MKYPRFVIRVIESKKDTVEMPQLEFSAEEALDYINSFIASGDENDTSSEKRAELESENVRIEK